jgi:linoleoyl-CoA desaturase
MWKKRRKRQVMKTQKLDIVHFAPKIKNGFYETVTANVRSYFSMNGISPYANAQMWFKTAIMLLLYFIPYVLIVAGVAAGNAWLFYGCWFIMGWGMIGLGTSVMHDAQHGTYSRNNKVNRFVGHILEVVGGYDVSWRIQHNVLHHTYTNVAGLDEDIDGVRFMRLSPHQPRYWFHKYQHIYIWFFYMIMTLYWMTAKDFIQVVRYRNHDLLVREHITLKQALFRLSLYKLFYYAYILVLPILFSGMAWFQVVLGFLLMHATAGLVLSCIFQPAHIMESSGFAVPETINNKKSMKDSWAVHEVANTTDFAPRNRLLTWFIGGLNFQIEHHLFVNICHVHYPKIAPIVRSVAEAFKIPYHVQPTFLSALALHVNMLKKLGAG